MAKLFTVVTGASSGIGLNFAEIMAADKHDLILVARNQPKLREIASKLSQAHGVEVKVTAADLGKPADVLSLIEQLKGLDIDTLINNAGIGLYGEFLKTDLAAELNMIQLNITALTQLTKAVLPQMVARRSGKILNVASTAAFQPGPLMAVYYATKAYVLSFSEAIASELEGTGVTVTALCPGATTSGFQDAANAGSSKLFQRKLPSASEVAAAGIRAMNAGKRVFIHGAMNRVGVQSVRFLPRTMVTKMVKNIQARV
ncbi:MAG: SDR family oxidoreductase [Deltaproteobacteria bacterium]|nr:SDR family oxidoreductase [Deltaproteobacteria bacterium]MBI3294540.1 SDR family oxidoreductase [Deltaproteobacteria bacterium]